MESGRESYLQFFRYYHTLKNMKFSQILNYFLFKRRRKKLSIIDNKRVSIISESLKENIKLEENEENIELSFYNQPIKFSLSEMKWDLKDFNSQVENQWITKLNSFEWLFEEISANISVNQLSFLILDWISKNTNEHSKTWDPLPLSKRLTSWKKWIDSNQIKPEIVSIIKLSVSLQLKRLFVDMEFYSPANHLLENLRGFLSGCCLLITSSQYFNNELEYQLEESIEECINQLNIQVLADGAHFERSPFYHSKMIEVVKDIKELSNTVSKQGFLLPEIIEKSQLLKKICDKKIPLMNNWLEKMTLPNGEISQFNDSVRIKGIKHSFQELTELLETSGFFIKHNIDYSFILSCESPSPAFLPQHSHCDIFSYELAINKQLAIIDSGCSGYDNETLRQMSRETEAHNLPMVQHQEQSDIWGKFNIGKRAKILQKTFNKVESFIEIAIEDQFDQILSRKVIFSPKSIEIYDYLKKRRIEGCFISLIHLAPSLEIEIRQEEKNIITCKMTNGIKFSIITKANIRVSDYIYFPDFGKSIGAKVLILSNKEAEELNYVIKW